MSPLHAELVSSEPTNRSKRERFASTLHINSTASDLVFSCFDMAEARKEADVKYGADWFQFPYSAYPIQVDLMNAIYKAIDEGKIGLFESPTGTVRI